MRIPRATALLVLAALAVGSPATLPARADALQAEAAAAAAALPTTEDFDVARRLAFSPPQGHAVTYTATPSPRIYMGLGSVFAVMNAADRARPALIGSLDLGTGGYGIQHVLTNAQNTRYVFAISGGSLYVVDVATPQAPTLAATLVLTGLQTHIAQSGTHLYIAAHDRVSIVNVQNPAAPSLAGTYASPGSINRGIAVSGSYAYVAGSASFFILNVSNPASPTFAGGIAQASAGMGVALAGSYAYVVASNSTGGLLVYNVSNPASPSLAGSLPSIGYPQDIAIGGTTAYIAGWNSQLFVVDIQAPAAPTLASTTIVTGFLSGVATGPANTVLLANVSTGLLVMDVTTPTAPSTVGAYGAGNFKDVAVAGNYAYAAGGYAGLVVIDLSLGRPVASYRSTQSVNSVAVAGQYAYLGEGYLFEIVNVANPLAPSRTGSVGLPHHVQGVAVANGYAYLNVDDGTLRAVDVRNPAAPAPVGTFTGGGAAGGIAVDGTHVYAARGPAGLQVVNVASPSNMVLASKYTLGNVVDVSFDRRLAYVATRETGFDLVDVTTPANPLLAGSAYVYTPMSVAARGDLLYGAGTDGVHVYDVCDPASPYEVAVYPIGGLSRVRFANGRLYGAGTAGVVELHYAGQCTDAYEPNDDLAHATSAAPNRVYQAGLCDGRDTDWYALGTLGPGRLEATLEPPAGRAFKLLLNRSGSTVAVSEPTGAGQQRLVADVTAGTYTLQVIGVGGDYDATHSYALSYRFAPCAGPGAEVYIRTVTLDVNQNAVLEILDPNQPSTVTGYNIYRAPGSADFELLAENVVDMDEGAPNTQYVDKTVPGEILFYRATAVNASCGIEGP